MNMPAAPTGITAPDAKPDVKGPTLVGLLIVVVFFGIFGGWAATAPLSSGAVAPGTIGVEGRRKTVQHLEGGIVSEILVREGQRVAAGETVVTLDQTRPKASLEVLRAQFVALVAQEARLIAERDGRRTIAFPAGLVEPGDVEGGKVLTGQTGIFEARIESLNSQSAILDQRIAQFRAEIRGLQAEMSAQSTQIALIEEEIDAAETLMAKGLQRKPRLLELKRRRVEIEGARAQNQATVARVEQNITEADMQIKDLSKSRHSEVVQELREVQTRLADVRERVAAAQDVLNRTSIVAPTSGEVVDLRIHTPGAVIGPGEPIMDIVPTAGDLVIEARVSPTDIDIVHPGLPAQVRFTAFNQRTTPVLDAVVQRISADILSDERSGETFYSARVLIDPDTEIPDGLDLYPGMPVEVLIVTGSRTVLEYLAQPISETFSRSMREQ